MVVVEESKDTECRSAQRGTVVHEWAAALTVLKLSLPHRECPHLIHKLLKSNLFRGRRLWRWCSGCRGTRSWSNHRRISAFMWPRNESEKTGSWLAGTTSLSGRSSLGARKVNLFSVNFTQVPLLHSKPKPNTVSSPIPLAGLHDGSWSDTSKYLRIRVMKWPYRRERVIKAGDA